MKGIKKNKEGDKNEYQGEILLLWLNSKLWALKAQYVLKISFCLLSKRYN